MNKKPIIEVKDNGTVVLIDDSFELVTDQEILDEICGGHNIGCQTNDGCTINAACL